MSRLGSLLVAVCLLAAPMAGCAEDDTATETGTDDGAGAGGESSSEQGTQYTYSAGGSQAANDDQGTFEAPSGQAHLSASVGGSGQLSVTVTDAAGNTVFEETYRGSGGSSESKDLSGEPGQWTVQVQVDYWSGGFSLDVQGS